MGLAISPPLTPLSLKMGGRRQLCGGGPRRGNLWMPAHFRNRVPTQMRRAIPTLVVLGVLLVLILTGDVFRVQSSGSVRSRGDASLRKRELQKPFDSFGSSSSSSSGAAAEPRSDGVPGFPRKIWQTWKVDPLNFEVRDSDTARSWTSKNRGFRYEVLTDDNDMAFVEQAFGPDGFDRPDIVDMYRAVNATIVKADLLRYLVMYAEGGVYADIDVEALKPVRRFVPERYDPRDVDMVIGIEIDQPEFRHHPILGRKSMSFCQWTFMAKPHLPVMLRLVENIMAWLDGVARAQGVPVSQVVLDFDEVISGTGPSAFTAAVLADMTARAGGEPVTWDSFHVMDESKLAAGVLVLDVEAFAAGQGHSDSGNHNARGALVKHHYHASNWPSRHPRFRHPAYGEVERCNWDAECVRRWDADVAAYETLPPEEQQRQIEAARAEEKRQLDEAQRLQEQALQLERWSAAVRRAEEEEEAQRAVDGRPEGEGGGSGCDCGAQAPPRVGAPLLLNEPQPQPQPQPQPELQFPPQVPSPPAGLAIRPQGQGQDQPQLWPNAGDSGSGGFMPEEQQSAPDAKAQGNL